MFLKIIKLFYVYAFFISCIFIFSFETKAAITSPWQLVSTSSVARSSAASAVIDNKIYIAGGSDGLAELSVLEEFDPAINTWKIKKPEPDPRWGASAGVIGGDRFFIIGGMPFPDGCNKTEVYELSTDTWNTKANMPDSGWGVAAGVISDKIYVVGGYYWSTWGQNRNREYDPLTDRWTLKSDMPTKRSWLGAEVIDSKLYAIGGWNWDDSVDLPTVEAYDPLNDSWSTKAPMPQGLKNITTAVLDKKIYVFGGATGEGQSVKFYSTVYVYDPAKDYWSKLDDLPLPIAGATAEAVNDTIYLIGGYTYGNRQLNTVYAIKNSELRTEIDPVIIVPGIMGSWNINGKWELDPILNTYDDIWEALKVSGYKEGETLFAFPYQWRQSNIYSASLLKDKIQEVKNICNCDKVDIVAHSMGGIVTRAYIEGDEYQNDIDQLIFLATPHRGSIGAYLMWEGGEFGVKPNSQILKRIFEVEAKHNDYSTIFGYIRNLPMHSVQELLPVYDYLRDKGETTLRTYPYNYPINPFLGFLNNPEQLSKLTEVKVMNIVADAGEMSTINSLRVVSEDFTGGQWEHGYPENFNLALSDHGLEYGSGDATVPWSSNMEFNDFENVMIENSDHLGIVADAQKKVIMELTGIEPAQTIRSNLFKKLLMIRVFSPVDFLVIAPDGRKIGKDFENNQAINEIREGFYSGFEDGVEFAVIPEPMDGEYKILLQGTGNGYYKLSSTFINDDFAVDKEFEGQVLYEEERIFDLNIDNESVDPIGEIVPEDNFPPEIIIYEPKENNNYLHSDKIDLNYVITDNFSGVDRISILLDGALLVTTGMDLFYYDLGMHELKIIADDKTGNRAEKNVSFMVTANIESSIKDIEKEYVLGWIKKEYVKKSLIAEFKILNWQMQIYNKLVYQRQKDFQKLLMLSQLNIIKKTADLFFQLKLLEKKGYDIIINNIIYLKSTI